MTKTSPAAAPARTRFAPSPTGFLHVGGIRTALFCWLLARQSGGQFVLRIEDTDQSRLVEGAEVHIIQSLKALGLDFDEGPFRQSQRLEIYKQWAGKLVETGRAYADPSSPAELSALREKAQAEKRPFLFREHRPTNPPTWDGTTPLRFKSEPKAYTWHDAIMGELSTGPEVIDDFILIKSDGYPTYNFAHIIDDELMQITHVIRGQEFMPSVPNYLNLYEALELKPPMLATVPHILAPSGNQKLSKRDGAKDVLDYIRDGFLPDALINFIAGLGWNDGTEQEIFSREELIAKFSLERIQRSGARFDEQRLLWMNGHYIRALSLEQLYQLVEDGNFWPASAQGAALNFKREVLRLIQERLKFLGEVAELTDFFFNDNYELDRELLLSSAQSLGDPAGVLSTVKTELADSDFSSQDLEKRLRSLVAKLDTKPQALFGLVRVAITGKQVAPGLWELLATLGENPEQSKQKALARLERAIALVSDKA